MEEEIRFVIRDVAQIGESVSCPVFCVGGFRALDTIGAVLDQTKIEAVSLSRSLLR